MEQHLQPTITEEFTERANSESSVRRPGYFIAALFLFTYLAILPFNFVGSPIAAGLDESYFAALNFMNQTGAKFGADIETTYGPLGYLVNAINIDSHILESNLLGVLLSGISAAVLTQLCFGTTVKRSIIVMLFYLSSCFFYGTQTRDYQLMTTFLLCLMSYFAEPRKQRLWTLFASSLIAAFSIYVKFNNALIMVLDLILAAAILLLTERKNVFPTILLSSTFFASATLIGIFTFGSLNNFVSFVGNSFDVASAYALAMSTVERSLPALIAAGLLFFVLAVGFLANLRGKERILIPLALSAIPLVMAFKHSFIREGNICKFPFVACICFAMLTMYASKNSQKAMIAVCAILLLVFVPNRLRECEFSKTSPLTPFTLSASIAALSKLVNLEQSIRTIDSLTERNFGVARLNEDWLKRLRDAKNGVDCIPFDVFYCFANKLKWHPNPPIQLAYAITPKMDSWCKNICSAEDSADFLLVGFPDCDWRHPFFTAPMSWRSIFSNYQSSGIDKRLNQVLLEKRTAPLRESLQPISEADFGADMWIPVPLNANVLIGEFQMKETTIGRIKKALYRVDPIYVDVAYKSGEYGYFRFLPNTANAGVIVSPLPRTLEGMHSFFAKQPMSQTTFIRFHGDGLNCYERKMHVRWMEANYSE